jgi:hypothetical protein
VQPFYGAHRFLNEARWIAWREFRRRRESGPPAAHRAARVNLFYPGVLTPCLSISMAFSNLFNRVSCFLASVIQRQYSLRCV